MKNQTYWPNNVTNVKLKLEVLLVSSSTLRISAHEDNRIYNYSQQIQVGNNTTREPDGDLLLCLIWHDTVPIQYLLNSCSWIIQLALFCYKDSSFLTRTLIIIQGCLHRTWTIVVSSFHWVQNCLKFVRRGSTQCVYLFLNNTSRFNRFNMI